MPTPIDPKKLPRLRAQLKRFKKGEKLPQQELAKIYGVTNARLTTLIKQRFADFPDPERHGDKTHWYEVRPAIESMIAYLEGRTKKAKAAGLRTARILAGPGAAVEPDEAPATAAAAAPEKVLPTPADLDKLASASTRVFRLEQEKGEFVRVAQVRAEFRDLFTIMQRHLTGLAAEIDPNGELPPLTRERLEQAVRAAQVKLHTKIAHHLGDVANAA